MADIPIDYKHLSQLDYSNIPALMNFIANGVFPPNIQTKRQKERYTANYGNGRFMVADGRLYYGNQQLEVVPDEERDTRLLTIYHDQTLGMGKGLNSMYITVSARLLNISKRYVSEWLKGRVQYQLTRKPQKSTAQVRRYPNMPNLAWQIDLVMMPAQRFPLIANANRVAILTVLDLGTRRCWLRGVTGLSMEDVIGGLAPIVRAQPLQAGPRGGQPYRVKVLQADNGFKNRAIAQFCRDNDILKQVYSQPYVPLSEIENLNKRLRDLINHLISRNGTRVWFPHLQILEDNLNHYAALARHPRDPVKQRGPFKFDVGDVVRVHQSQLNTRLLERAKDGANKKYTHIQYSVRPYLVHARHISNSVNGLPTYELITTDPQYNPPRVLSTTPPDPYPIRFKENMLLQLPFLPDPYGPHMTQEQSDRLNTLVI